MEIKVYLHRTKKHNFEIADCFTVVLDLDQLPEDKKEDLDFINKGLRNDCRNMAYTRDCVKKYGTGYLSFMRPQYEGPEEENGNKKIYFDNETMLFVKRPIKRTRKKKATEVNNDKIQ